MVFIYLASAVIIATFYFLLTGKSRIVNRVLIYLGLGLFFIGWASFLGFGEGEVDELLLIREFSFSTRLVFISYVCLMVGLILSIANYFKD